MRKRMGTLSLVFSLCAALLLGSCSQPPPGPSSTTLQSVPNTADEESDAVAFEKDEYHFSDLYYGYGIDGGFYQTLYREDHSSNLTYIDYATSAQAVLCDREDCAHGDENCPGWISGSSYKPDVYVANDTLFLIWHGNDLEPEHPAVPPTVAVSDLQGKNRRTLCTLEQGKWISYGAASDGESLFLIVSNQYDPDTFFCELLRIDLTTGEGTSLYEGDAGVTLELAGCVENGLVVKSTLPAASAQSTPASSEDPELGTYANTETQLMLIDKNGNRKPFMRWTTGECTEGVLGGLVFYFRDGNVMACDPLTGQETQIATGFSSYDPMDITFSGYDDGMLLMDAIDLHRDENAARRFVQVRYAINVEDGTYTKIELAVEQESSSMPPVLLACDKEYFLLGTEQLRQEISVDGICMRDRVSTISKADFYASEPNYSLVEPAFGPGHIRTKTEVFSHGGSLAI